MTEADDVTPLGAEHEQFKYRAAIDGRVPIVTLVKALSEHGLTITARHSALIIHRLGDQIEGDDW